MAGSIEFRETTAKFSFALNEQVSEMRKNKGFQGTIGQIIWLTVMLFVIPFYPVLKALIIYYGRALLILKFAANPPNCYRALVRVGAVDINFRSSREL
jgi:hypothetical protein